MDGTRQTKHSKNSTANQKNATVYFWWFWLLDVYLTVQINVSGVIIAQTFHEHLVQTLPLKSKQKFSEDNEIKELD